MSYLMGIDLGSTNLKAIIYDPSGKAVASASRPTERFNPDESHPEWAVWRPEQIWGGVAESIQEAISKIDDPSAVRGVCVTGMGMDGLPIDENGEWLYPMISWHCPRTAPQHEWWMDNIGAERQFSISGTQLWVFCSALRLRWMRENEPEIYEKTHKWLLIEDFVNFMLCGAKATDYSMASTTLLFDQKRRTWSDELLEASGIDRSILCDPHPAGTVLGGVHAKASEATGLTVGTPIVLGGHDYCCGELPTGAFRPGVLLDVLGTWEMVVGSLETPTLTPKAMATGMFIDSHVAKDMWTFMGATVAGDMLEWFKTEFGVAESQKAESEGGVDWDYLIKAGEAAPVGSGGAMFLPHMSGSHCPVVDHKSLGAFVGLKNIASRGHMFRAVIEGLNYQFRQIMGSVESVLGERQEKVVAIGGVTQNRLWMQNKADVIGRPVEVPDLDEAVPLGAAILAGIGVGIYKDEQDAFEQVSRPGKIYEPNPENAAKYDELFPLFEKLYPALKEIHGVISEG
jgi:xylulokinase